MMESDCEMGKCSLFLYVYSEDQIKVINDLLFGSFNVIAQQSQTTFLAWGHYYTLGDVDP
jgi:hypothetical protein